MKKPTRVLTLSIAVLLAAAPTQSATLTWDAGNTGNGAVIDPADGTWDTNAGNPAWNNAGVNVGWSQTSPTAATNAAVFAGTDGTYTVTVGAALATQSLTFSNSGYTLAAASAQTITNNGNITVATGKTATIGANVTISRAAGFSISGGGGTLLLDGTVVCTAASASEISSNSTVEVRTGGALNMINSGSASLVIGELGTNDPNGNNGTLLVSGGTVNLVGTGNFVLGNVNTVGSVTNSNVTISNGAINVSATSGNGIRFGSTTQAGGTVTGVFNLDGGTVTAPSVTRVTPTGTGVINATFNFNGGTLVANKTNATFLQNLTTASVKANGARINSNGFDITIAQALLDGTGGGGLEKLGAGTMTLTGANTYAGTTTISAGTLQLGNGGTTGSLGAGAIVNNGTLAINRSNALTLSSGISGTGGVNVLGSGTTTIAGVNTYTGDTNANAGRLNIAGSLTSAVNVASSVNLGGEGSTTGALTFSGTHALLFDPTTPGALTAGSVNASAATITVTPTTAGSGTGIVVLSAAGGITGTVGVNFFFTGRGTTYLNGTSTELLFDSTAATVKWRGNDGTNPTFWDLTTTNWLNGPTADQYFDGDVAVFDDTATSFAVAVQGASVSPGSVTFDNATTYTVSGGGITGFGTLTKTGSGVVVLENTNTFTGGTTISAGTLQLGNGGPTGSLVGAIVNNATLATDFGANAVTVASEISGTGAVVQNGSGTVSLTAANSYGATTINNGTLQVGDGGTSGTLGTGAVTNNAVLAFNRSDAALDTANVISGTGSVVKLGTGTLTLSGASTYDGTTTVSAGTLLVTNGAALGSAVGGTTVANGAALHLSGGITVTGETLNLTGQGISSLGALRNMSGNNTWAGDITTVSNGGLVRIGSESGHLTISGNIATGTTAVDQNVLQGGGNITVSGVISGPSKLTSSSTGAGVRTLSGANTYTGQTVINGGTLSVSSLNRVSGGTASSSLGAPIDVASGTITVGTTNAVGTLRYTGTGESTDRVIHMAGTTFGATIEANGAAPLIFESATTSAAGAKTLTLTGTTGGEFSAGVGGGAGTISLAKTGSGTWVLGGTSPYTGATTISAGTLVVNGTLSGSTTTTIAGGTLAGGGTTGPIIANAGTIAPGNSPGKLTANGAVTLNAGSTLALELNGLVPATDYDQLAVNGGVTLNNATLALSGSYMGFNDLFFVLINDGTDAIAGTFNGLTEGSSILAQNGQEFTITYAAEFDTLTATGGNDVALMAVPEPGSAVLLLGGLALLGARRRRA